MEYDSLFEKLKEYEVVHHLPTKIAIQQHELVMDILNFSVFQTPELIPHLCLCGGYKSTEMKSFKQEYVKALIHNSTVFPSYVKGVIKKEIDVSYKKAQLLNVFQEIEDSQLGDFRGCIELEISKKGDIDREFAEVLQWYLETNHKNVRVCLLLPDKKLYEQLLGRACVPIYTVFNEKDTALDDRLEYVVNQLEAKYNVSLRESTKEIIDEWIKGGDIDIELLIQMIAFYEHKDKSNIDTVLREKKIQQQKKATIGFSQEVI